MKIRVLILAALVAVSVVACGGESDTETPVTAKPTPEVANDTNPAEVKAKVKDVVEGHPKALKYMCDEYNKRGYAVGLINWSRGWDDPYFSAKETYEEVITYCDDGVNERPAPKPAPKPKPAPAPKPAPKPAPRGPSAAALDRIDVAVTLACPHFSNIVDDAAVGILAGQELVDKLLQARNDALNWPRLAQAIERVAADINLGRSNRSIQSGAKVFDLCIEGRKLVGK